MVLVAVALDLTGTIALWHHIKKAEYKLKVHLGP
jgi:hypothetical protein